MPHTANGHNLEVIHMGYCRDCGGTSLIAGVQAQNVDAAPSPWIAVSDQKPTEADANSEGEVWGIYVANTKKPFVMEVAASLVSEHPAMWSHWCPKESKPPLPAAPQPPSDL